VTLAVSLVTFAADAGPLARVRPRRRRSSSFVERHGVDPTFGIEYYLGIDGIQPLLIVLTAF